ncbi:glycosyltransferase family 2 protein [Mediterraneibacter glycyrrhizinilyticus]|uniref:glycosyltransferase family 2 protein n=1 Tax=Mediterraneibacter glycyrrhizinilyticus TaxID=342942 RepID=UPI0025AB46B3|nr:glycosyltransferase family 2 protein [Mediterraneibacter glycyrrhizinilyticus]MDN0061369.1 glycosyltransferase family 2 protein [Mediterraneibacter glycyrrhizinilyticus]
MSKDFLTVFTPAYNRAKTLPRTYESLKKQSCKEFIWLIVDDGSQDNTRELVQEWQKKENGFRIEYLYKENGGMHTAHNTAYEHIHTELNICIDSDDCLADDAVQKIKDKWKEIKDKDYAGIIGLDADLTGKVIGKRFPEGLKETTLTGYYAAGGSGDKKLVYRTEVIQKYPKYPEFPDEKYVGLNYLYLLIDQDYTLSVLNEVLCNVEYQPDGSSGTMLQQYRKNPKGFAFLRRIYMEYPTSRKRLFKDCIHYVSSCIFAKERHFVSKSPRKGWTILAIPFGLMLNAYIVIKTNFKIK